MRRWMSVAVVAAACMAVLAAPASARLRAHLGSVRPGWVSLAVSGPPGSVVPVSENGGVVMRISLGKDGHRTIRRLSEWSCRVRDRAFVVAGLTLTTRTPSCASRVRVAGIARPRAGQWFPVSLGDRWRLGNVHAQVCLVAPAATYACRTALVARSGSVVRFKAPRPGRWTVSVTSAFASVARPLLIRPATSRKLRVLATGDSLMIRVARHFRKQLRGKRTLVQRDIHFGAGISHNFVYDWRPGSRKEAISAHPPDVVVLFLGGSEGVPFGAIECCGQAWIDEYAKRVRQIIHNYRRGGAAQIYWLNLPAPQDPERAVAFRAANQGLAAATAGLAPWTRLLDESELLTPGFVYRYSTVINGQEVILRQADGLHLSRAGAIMTATMITQVMQADGVIP
jgi:lysophospholipase L1-like esterase